MMSDDSETSVPKLVDFGLAKIIGPSETAVEPFGTVGYVAPEVLKKEPYSFSCDLWSLGCITFALISGSLPFDHENNKETIKLTLNAPLVFDLPVWKTVSNEAKDLIIGLMQKDPQIRTTLAAYFESKWIKGSKLKEWKD